MGAYMYPIIVKEEKQIIKYSKTYEIPERLTLKILKKFVSDNDRFSFFIIGNNEIRLEVYKERLETNKEHQNRVIKEKKYMKEYDKRQEFKK